MRSVKNQISCSLRASGRRQVSFSEYFLGQLLGSCRHMVYVLTPLQSISRECIYMCAQAVDGYSPLDSLCNHKHEGQEIAASKLDR